MDYSDCIGNFEKTYFYVLLILAISSIFGLIFLGLNGKEAEKKSSLIFDGILGAFYWFFSGSTLNERGQKWRPLFVISWLGLIILFLIADNYGICESVHKT